MGQSLVKLTEEMAQSLPERAWYEAHVRSLRETMESEGPILQPLHSTLDQFTPLLLEPLKDPEFAKGCETPTTPESNG
jgi:hypothetical protein